MEGVKLSKYVIKYEKLTGKIREGWKWKAFVLIVEVGSQEFV